MKNPFDDPEDKLLFAKTLDKLALWEKRRMQAFTDFLNPVQTAAFMTYLGNQNATAFGGFDNAERMMIGFGADSGDDFPITPVSAMYNEKFSSPPTHRDYLGAVLGLGLDRSKVGDIVIADAGAVLYVAQDISAYIAESLTQVGRVRVKMRLGEVLEGVHKTGTEKYMTVASLRVDAVVSGALNLSRGKAAELIAREKVFVNWKLAKKTQIVQAGDVVTIRGMGRITIGEEEGRTKKDRIRLTITKL